MIFSEILFFLLTASIAVITSPMNFHKCYLQHALELCLSNPEQHVHGQLIISMWSWISQSEYFTCQMWMTEEAQIELLSVSSLSTHALLRQLKSLAHHLLVTLGFSKLHLPLQNVHTPSKKTHSLFKQTTNKSTGMQVIKWKDRVQSSSSLNLKITFSGLPYT